MKGVQESRLSALGAEHTQRLRLTRGFCICAEYVFEMSGWLVRWFFDHWHQYVPQSKVSRCALSCSPEWQTAKLLQRTTAASKRTAVVMVAQMLLQWRPVWLARAFVRWAGARITVCCVSHAGTTTESPAVRLMDASEVCHTPVLFNDLAGWFPVLDVSASMANRPLRPVDRSCFRVTCVQGVPPVQCSGARDWSSTKHRGGAPGTVRAPRP